jgi:phosphoenolpyruvate synthase/pyruvate phosphate dikinase
MTNIVTLKKATQESLGLIGEKSITLALLNQKFKVPPAFIITATATESILDSVEKQWQQALKAGVEAEQYERKAEELQAEILQMQIPEEIKDEIHDAYFSLHIEEGQSLNDLMKQGEESLVAVRPVLLNSNDSFSSSTILGVQGIETVLQAIKEVLASFYNPETIEYRSQHPEEKVKYAIIIQRMIDTTASGIMHTSYKMNAEEVLIFGCKGLGTALESGLIQPDKYFITKKTLNLAGLELGKQPFMLERDFETNKIAKIYLQEEYSRKQKIPDRYLGELTLLSKEIEKLFAKPQELSFGIAKETVYFFGTKDAGWHKEMQTSAGQKKPSLPKILELTKEEIEKKEQEISTHITEELNQDTLVARAINIENEQQSEQVSTISDQQSTPEHTPYDPNDINSVVMSIDFNALVQESEHVVEQQTKQPLEASVILSEQRQTIVHLTEQVAESEETKEQEEIVLAETINQTPLTLLEKTAGEIIIHCFKELKKSMPKEQWASSPELRHVAVLAQNFSQKNVAPTAAQVKLAMDAVEKGKNT